MNSIYLIVLHVVFNLIFVKGTCFYSFNPNKSPFFFQRFGKELLFFPNFNEIPGSLMLEELIEILVVCPSGFTKLNYDPNGRDDHNYNEPVFLEEGISTITLKCINDKTKIKIKNRLRNFENAECTNSAKLQIFEIGSDKMCAKNFYSIGLNIENSPITLANICLDLDNMRLEYLHYLATSVTPVLSHQIKTRGKFEYFKQIEVLDDRFFINEDMVNNLIAEIMGPQSNFLTFKYDNLYTPDNYYPLQNLKNLNKFIGWRNLIEGNWESFRNLLKSRSEKHSYDVYLGTSEVVTVPTNDCNLTNKKLILKEYSKVVSVPKYIWAYLKSRNNQTEEFVVIGVNTPYFEFYPKNQTIFCDDICNDIDWLKPLKWNRKKLILGYVFCCRTDQVQNKLDGFPRFIPEQNNTSEMSFTEYTPTYQYNTESTT